MALFAATTILRRSSKVENPSAGQNGSVLSLSTLPRRNLTIATTMRNIFPRLLALSGMQTRDENRGNIYTTPMDTVNGSFVFPRTWPMSFREGSTINVSWTTKYSTVNLYYYQRGKVANSVQVASKSPTTQLSSIYIDKRAQPTSQPLGPNGKSLQQKTTSLNPLCSESSMPKARQKSYWVEVSGAQATT